MKLKTFTRIIYLLVISLLVLSLSGCHNDDDDNYSDSSNSNNNAQSITSGKFIGIKAPSLLVGESYKIYKGNFRIAGTNAKYYVAPVSLAEDDTTAAINLSFNDFLSSDEALIITTSDDEANAVFAYNPYGTVSYDIDTPYGNVYRFGGTQMKYTNLHLASTSNTSALDADYSNVIDIMLNGSSATVNGISVPEYFYEWHADPNHINEYFTLNDNSGELTEEHQSRYTLHD